MPRWAPFSSRNTLVSPVFLCTKTPQGDNLLWRGLRCAMAVSTGEPGAIGRPLFEKVGKGLELPIPVLTVSVVAFGHVWSLFLPLGWTSCSRYLLSLCSGTGMHSLLCSLFSCVPNPQCSTMVSQCVMNPDVSFLYRPRPLRKHFQPQKGIPAIWSLSPSKIILADTTWEALLLHRNDLIKKKIFKDMVGWLNATQSWYHCTLAVWFNLISL